MPELPEVETIKNALERHLLGRTFTGVRIIDERPIQGMRPNEFARRLVGRKILGLRRRGKYLIMRLSGGLHLIIHLRMTGALLWNPKGIEPFARARFVLDNKESLIFSDIRRFGTIHLVRDPETVVSKLGMEPFSQEFTPQFMASLFQSRKSPVKSVLLDQQLMAGIGNMYADEALFQAGIHPLRAVSSLNQKEIRALHDAIQSVLKKGIKNRGASIRNYRTPDGAAGSAHKEFSVAHRKYEPCPKCGTPIERIVVAQRGTYYCPVCQRTSER